MRPQPARFALHVRSGGLGKPERPVDIGLEQRAPIRFGDLLDRTPSLPAHPAGRERQHVEPALGCDDSLDKPVRAGAIG